MSIVDFICLDVIIMENVTFRVERNSHCASWENWEWKKQHW